VIELSFNSRRGSTISKESCDVSSGRFDSFLHNKTTCDLDKSTVICTYKESAVSLIKAHENIYYSWHFEDGKLILELDDGTSLTFERIKLNSKR